MQEEIMGFGPGGASILGFSDLETLPKPPPENPPNEEGDAAVTSQTWFYYLAEVASWKLLNRVSKELYQGMPPWFCAVSLTYMLITKTYHLNHHW
jgi:hypothetical protein